MPLRNKRHNEYLDRWRKIFLKDKKRGLTLREIARKHVVTEQLVWSALYEKRK